MRKPDLRLSDRTRKAVVREFSPRFTRSGQLLWVSEGTAEPAQISASGLKKLGLGSLSSHELPNVLILDRKRRWLFLVDVAAIRGQVTVLRCEALKQVFQRCDLGFIFVSAYQHRAEFQSLGPNFAWGTSAWFADEPAHMLHFNGGVLGGPF